jgi:hypothetical protein
MVITVIGQQTLKSIGRSRLYLFNNRCNLKHYTTFGSRTRCGKCQLYGHPTTRCNALHPACAVCAQAHYMLRGCPDMERPRSVEASENW